MWNRLAIVLSVLLLSFKVFLLSNAPILYGRPFLPKQKEPPLGMEAIIIDQKYCESDASIMSLQLHLHLRFTNKGRQVLTLGKESNLVSKFSISEIGESEPPKATLYEGLLTTVTSPWKSADEMSASELVVALQPGESYELDSSLPLTIGVWRNNEGDNSRKALKVGDYKLQVAVETWYRIEGTSKRTLRRKKKGGLSAVLLVSTPTRFSILKDPQVSDCSAFSELLEAARSDPNAKIEKGFTALMAAINNSDTERFSDLLKRGADVNARAENGLTPLMVASIRSDEFFLQELIQHGAEVNAQNDDGESALYWAVKSGNVENVKILVASGANINERDKNGKTPLKRAEEIRDNELKEDIIHLLKKAGAKE